MTVVGDVSFSTESLATVSAVVLTLWSALVYVWRQQSQEYKSRIAHLEKRIETLTDALTRTRCVLNQRIESSKNDPPEKPGGSPP